jgi:hypothetical protein
MGSFQLGRGERLQCWRNVLRFFVISPFTGDFAYRLNAADHAGSCAVAHASVDAFEEAVVRTTRRMGSLWFDTVSSSKSFDTVLVFVCVELLLLSGQESALLGQRTRPVAGFGALVL